MATETLALADALLRDVYRGPVSELVNYRTYMLDRIERDAENVTDDGRRAIFPVHMQPNMSDTSIPDGGTLPDPGNEVEVDGILTVRYHAASLELTDALIKKADGKPGSFVNILQDRTERLAKTMRKAINRQVFGDGTGLIATLASSPAGVTTVTVDTTQYLRPGVVVDILTKSNGAVVHAKVKIDSINRATKVLTFASNITATTTTDGIYKPGARNLESDGLRNITATGRILHGINSSTAGQESWNGNRRAASGNIAGESLFEQLADDIGSAQDMGEVEVFLTTRGIKRRLADTYTSLKRYNDARAVEIHGGYTAIYVGEVPVIADDDVPKGWVFALRDDAFLWLEVAPPDWLSSPRDGTVWHLAAGSVAGTHKAAWRAYYVWYAALGCKNPAATGAIPDAQDDAATQP